MERVSAILARRPRLSVFLLGMLASLGQAPSSMPVATVLAIFVAFLVLQELERLRDVFIAGWLFGVGYFAASLVWLIEPFLVDPIRHAWMAPFALGAMAGGLALFWGIATGFAKTLSVGARVNFLIWALLFAVAELVRGYIFSGFPWASIGHVWIDTPIAQSASIFGAQGLTVLTFIIAGTLYFYRSKLWPIVGIVIAFIALSLWNTVIPPQNIVDDEDRPIVRLIQPNAPQHLKWHPDHVRGFFDKSLEFTSRSSEKTPDLIVWPETSVPALLEHSSTALERIKSAANGVATVFGIQRRQDRRYFNSLVLMDGFGHISGVYDKHHLVPFGEYIPFGDQLARIGISAFAAQEGHGYSPGPAPRTLNIPGIGEALPLICYEAVFPQDLLQVDARPDFLLQITNDAWFGNWIGPFQHLAQARLRAIEQGLPLIRAANTGVSAMISPTGEVIAEIPLNQTGFLDVAMPNKRAPTIYSRIGDMPWFIFYFCLMALFIWRRVRN